MYMYLINLKYLPTIEKKSSKQKEWDHQCWSNCQPGGGGGDGGRNHVT